MIGDDSILNFSKLEYIFDKRLSKAVKLETNKNIATLLEHHLGLSRFENNNAEVFDMIKISPAYQYWLNDIRERLIKYKN